MTWLAVARKEFRDGVRSKSFLGVAAVFVGLFVGSAVVFGTGTSTRAGRTVTTNHFSQSVARQLFVTSVVPIAAIVTSYGAVAGERESGSLKLTLSLPHSRRDALVGKLAGRGAVVALPVLVSLALALVVLGLAGVAVAVPEFVGFVALTVLLGFVFVAIAVGFSAAASTGRRSILGSAGLLLVFTALWGQVRQLLLVANDLLSLGLTNVQILQYGLFLKYLNPLQAYQTLAASAYMNSPVGARLYEVVESPARAGLYDASSFQHPALVELHGDLPFYLSDGVVLAQFLLWLVLPVAVGYWAFRDAAL